MFTLNSNAAAQWWEVILNFPIYSTRINSPYIIVFWFSQGCDTCLLVGHAIFFKSKQGYVRYSFFGKKKHGKTSLSVKSFHEQPYQFAEQTASNMEYRPGRDKKARTTEDERKRIWDALLQIMQICFVWKTSRRITCTVWYVSNYWKGRVGGVLPIYISF